MKISRSVILGLALLVLAVPVWSADNAAPAARNYDIVFHTKLFGQAEDVTMTVSEGHFQIRTVSPVIEVIGNLEVTEDFMHRLEFQFMHELSGGKSGENGSGRFYRRSGSVILEPGEEVRVVEAPDIELRIELRKSD